MWRTPSVRGDTLSPTGLRRQPTDWVLRVFLALVTSCCATRLLANDVLINGVSGPGDSSPDFILVSPGQSDTVDIVVDTVDLIGPAGDTIRVNGLEGNSRLVITAGRTVSGATSTGAYLKATTGDLSAVVDGTLRSAANGITLDTRFAPPGGNVQLSGIGRLFGDSGTAAWLLADVGSIEMDGFQSIQAGTTGVLVNSAGAVRLGATTPIGAIFAGGTGIEVDLLDDPLAGGPIVIRATDITAQDGFGIRTKAGAAETSVLLTGTLKSSVVTGIYATSTTGDISISGGGTGIVDGGDAGITADAGYLPAGGNVVVSEFASVSGRDAGIWALTDAGSVTVDRIASVTSGTDGIRVYSHGGVRIGESMPGSINAGHSGILVEQVFDPAANGPILVRAAQITSGLYGIRTIGWETETAIQVVGSVDAGNFGISASSNSGGITIDIAGSGDVRGTVAALEIHTQSGTATVNNSGVLRNTADSGSAADPGAEVARVLGGSASVNNTGRIAGRFTTDGSDAFSLANQAQGEWIPATGVHSFGGADDSVENAGTISVRTGSTVFAGLESFRNHSGGLIDLSYGARAIDELRLENFSSLDGSAMTFHFDAAGANNSGAGFDHSSDGLGTADTIVVTGRAEASGTSLVNVLSTGGPPAAETGSVSLIYTGVDLLAPGVSGPSATSQFYVFGPEAPAGGAVSYYLVDDGQGGLYLQWAPDVTTSSVGGFLGGAVDSTRLAPSAASVAAGNLGTIVGGIGGLGGPSGGGVTGRIGDTTVASMLGRSSRCLRGRLVSTWGLVGSAGTSYSPGGQGSFVGYAAGIERDLSDVTGAACGRTAAGTFFFENQTNDRWLTGSTYTEAHGMGTYLRAGSAEGLYGALIGTLSWSDSDIVNRVYRSTANQDHSGYTLGALGGYLIPLSAATSADFRGLVSWGEADGDSFTDSAGMTIFGTDAGIATLGVMSGLQHRLNTRQTVMARGGVKWYELDRTIAARGTRQSGAVDSTVGSVEAGYSHTITPNVSFDAWLNGDFGEHFTSGGGRAGLTIGL